jgi:hypothetical protein
LVERNERRAAEDIRDRPDGAGVLERGRGVESARRVVPSDNGSAVNEDLGERNTLAFSAGYSTDEFAEEGRVGQPLVASKAIGERGKSCYPLSNKCVAGVLDAEGLKESIEELCKGPRQIMSRGGKETPPPHSARTPRGRCPRAARAESSS